MLLRWKTFGRIWIAIGEDGWNYIVRISTNFCGWIVVREKFGSGREVLTMEGEKIDCVKVFADDTNAKDAAQLWYERLNSKSKNV